MECLVCSRIQEIKENRNPYFVCETETGYVVIGDFHLFMDIPFLSAKYALRNFMSSIPLSGRRFSGIWRR